VNELSVVTKEYTGNINSLHQRIGDEPERGMKCHSSFFPFQILTVLESSKF
jgi:hypothetical protein